MDRQEWLAERRKGIGGSDAGAIVGLNKYKNAFDVYADKLGLLPEKEDNEAMRQGRDLEQYVAERFCEVTGKKVRRKNRILHSEKYPFALANIDRTIVGEDAGLECKTSNVLSLKRYKNGEYPPEYYCQCMHYMAVTGAEKWYLAVLIFGKEFKIFTIERDEDEIAALMNAERNFWENHVEKQIPPVPEGTDGNSDTISKLYPNSNGETIVFASDDLLRRAKEKSEEIKRLETEKKQLEQEIKTILQDCERGEGTNYCVTWKSRSRELLDKKKLEADLGDISKYTKISTSRYFEIKERD